MVRTLYSRLAMAPQGLLRMPWWYTRMAILLSKNRRRSSLPPPTSRCTGNSSPSGKPYATWIFCHDTFTSSEEGYSVSHAGADIVADVGLLDVVCGNGLRD